MNSVSRTCSSGPSSYRPALEWDGRVFDMRLPQAKLTDRYPLFVKVIFPFRRFRGAPRRSERSLEPRCRGELSLPLTRVAGPGDPAVDGRGAVAAGEEIGRASCRERVCASV